MGETRVRRRPANESGEARQATARRRGPRAASGRCARSSMRLAMNSASAALPDSSIVTITQRAGVALGTFYTYFDSKEAVFQALVRDMSAQVRDHVAPALGGARGRIDGERRALEPSCGSSRDTRDVYRIIDEAEFVEPAAYREHYETTASRIAARLRSGRDKGEIDPTLSDSDISILAWALMGANVFLGLRFAVWDEAEPASVAALTKRLLAKGIAR